MKISQITQPELSVDGLARDMGAASAQVPSDGELAQMPAGAPVGVRLFTIPGSHPGWTARLMLEYKGIGYKRTDLLPVVSWVVLKTLRFPGVTVPAIKIDGRKVQGSREISRELERIKPDPPLFPSDPDHRAAVEEAERFGDEELQHPIRQILLRSWRKNTSPLGSYLEGARIGMPHGLAAKTAGPFIALDGRANGASEENVRRDISILAGLLARVDDWIAEGVLGGEQLNAADFQIAPSLRLAMSLEDLRPAIENRPAGELALRVVPNYPGRTPPVLPADWLEPLHAPA
jgi:glutathione S-transferase